MDIIDNLIYASYVTPVWPAITGSSGIPSTSTASPDRVHSDYIKSFLPSSPPSGTPRSYLQNDKMRFCSFSDYEMIKTAKLRHWFDIDLQRNYDEGGYREFSDTILSSRYISFETSSNYHLIYAYLLENTRILQIFEKMIDKYSIDEEFGISGDPEAVGWIRNSFNLFLSKVEHGNNNNDSKRRNAYWRMFGMDLAFGENISGGAAVPYFKANSSNQQFIIVFEKYLSEIWRGYMNANNTSGPDSTDLNIITNLSIQLKELLLARRGVGGLTYSNQNLSNEEFNAVLITSWFTFIISYNSPVVEFLNCQSSTIGERLIKIGSKVGIPAHGKCQFLFEMAGSASITLNAVETGSFLENTTWVDMMLKSIPGPTEEYMNHFLTIINNWEKATGHNIKNQEANIKGTVRIQNGVKMQSEMN